MKGLLIKDILTTVKQLRVFLVLMVLMVMVPGSSSGSFIVAIAAMLPLTSMAYDERCKWDELALTMPYTPQEMVLSKYLMGYIMLGGLSVVVCLTQVAASIIQNVPLDVATFLQVGLFSAVALVILAVNLPLVYKMGVEKGRIMFLLIVGGMIFSSTVFQQEIMGWILQIQDTPIAVIGLAAALVLVVLNLGSIAISTKWYQAKA